MLKNDWHIDAAVWSRASPNARDGVSAERARLRAEPAVPYVTAALGAARGPIAATDYVRAVPTDPRDRRPATSSRHRRLRSRDTRAALRAFFEVTDRADRRRADEASSRVGRDPDVVRQAIDRYGRSGTGPTEPWLV
jgi:pyruvate dehydrogenase E1 component